MQIYKKDNKIVIGIDECGRGCFSGPMVTSAVILPENFNLTDIDDSKKLSNKKKLQSYDRILKECIAYGIGEVSAKEIDENGLTWANIECFNRAILNLKYVNTSESFLNYENSYVIVDGIIKPTIKNLEYETIIKGDGKYAQIASASIIAKVYRDNLMEKLAEKYPYYDWENNAGYGTPKHIKGLNEYGYCEEHRLLFIKDNFKKNIKNE